MKRSEERESGVSAVMGSTLLVGLLVLLAVVIAAIVMGLGKNVDEPILAGFNVEPYYNNTSIFTGFSLMNMAGDSVQAQGGSTSPSGGKTIKQVNIILVDPTQKNNIVTLCSSTSGVINLSPGTQYYVVKRKQPNYYLVTSLTQGNCGGGGGSGGGSGGQTNLALQQGVWRITVSDLSSEAVLYEKEFKI